MQADFEGRLAAARDEAAAAQARHAAEWQAKLDAAARERTAALEEAEKGALARVAEAEAEWRRRLDAAHQEWATERAQMDAAARAAATAAEAAAQRRLQVRCRMCGMQAAWNAGSACGELRSAAEP